MKHSNSKLSEQFVDFIDLTDEELEEINVPELGHGQIAGGFGSCGASALAIAVAGSCSCGGFGGGFSCFGGGFSCFGGGFSCFGGGFF